MWDQENGSWVMGEVLKKLKRNSLSRHMWGFIMRGEERRRKEGERERECVCVCVCLHVCREVHGWFVLRKACAQCSHSASTFIKAWKKSKHVKKWLVVEHSTLAAMPTICHSSFSFTLPSNWRRFTTMRDNPDAKIPDFNIAPTKKQKQKNNRSQSRWLVWRKRGGNKKTRRRRRRPPQKKTLKKNNPFPSNKL